MSDTRQTTSITEQETLPLNVLAIQGALCFRAYLQRYHLHPLDVAHASNVRYLTVWNVEQGKPVSRVNVARVRLGLWRLTGVPFMAPLALLEQPGR